ncbi:interferon lambda receptor 1 [Sphaerodactylus townsendi]|uniref:Uncharacterized protein n=1 Tax=Sphaerodactylus townsendi TaxID=933632 RepID=A0ACB8FQJ3_9SAUR|nr:interferon lambda receptor 1 [Sphaerodactylus townsendi]
MTLWRLVALLSFSRVLLGEMLLPPPPNVTLVSKDFNLFLTWLPGADYPPGVFYSVQWTNVYNDWKDFLPCRNISETVCNITCASPDVFHSYDVRVKAQASAGTSASAWVNWEGIEYEVDVKLAPPDLQVRKNGDTIVVNATFSYPLCLKDLFHDLTADLEIREVGTNNTEKITVKNTEDFDASVFNGNEYCFSARAKLDNMHSNFSEPTCLQLHKAGAWAFAAVPVLLLFILVLFIVLLLYQSKSRPVKSPQALEFSSLKYPKKFLEFNKKEFISVLTCPGHPVGVENRSRLIPQVRSQLVPAVLEEYGHEEEEDEEDDEDDDDDDPGSHIPYTEIRPFQKNELHSQMVGLDEKGSKPCSESDSSELDEGSMPGLCQGSMPRSFVLTNTVFEETHSRYHGCETPSLSAGTSSEKSSACSDCYLASQRGLEDLDHNTEVLFQLSDCNLPTGKLFIPLESVWDASFGTLGDQQISLFREQNHQDFCDLFLEDEKLSANYSCGYKGDVVEESPLKVPSRDDLEDSMLGGNKGSVADCSPQPKYHGYRSRPVHYLSRILPE